VAREYNSTLMQARGHRFTVLVYRMPARPTAGRVAVWRQLKKIGSIYLQQSVCVFPANPQVRSDLHPILEKITASGGEFHLLPLRQLDSAEESKLIQQFLDQTSNHYREIIENCEVNFTKEIEFETFRKNFTYEEAEEIRSEFEKICVWFERVHRRDWFGAANEAEARGWVARCEAMLEQFEARVFGKEDGGGGGAPKAPTQRRRRPLVVSEGKTSPRSLRG
jgi:ChrB-like protein